MNAPQLEFAFSLEVTPGPIREIGAGRAGPWWLRFPRPTVSRCEKGLRCEA